MRDPMEIQLQHAQSRGELILDEPHKPCRSLACPLIREELRARKETKHPKQARQAAEKTRAGLANFSL